MRVYNATLTFTRQAKGKLHLQMFYRGNALADKAGGVDKPYQGVAANQTPQ